MLNSNIVVYPDEIAKAHPNTPLYFVPTETYCRNCDGGGGCMDCVMRYVHDECDPESCPECEGSLKVETYYLHPTLNDIEALTALKTERYNF